MINHIKFDVFADPNKCPWSGYDSDTKFAVSIYTVTQFLDVVINVTDSIQYLGFSVVSETQDLENLQASRIFNSKDDSIQYSIEFVYHEADPEVFEIHVEDQVMHSIFSCKEYIKNRFSILNEVNK